MTTAVILLDARKMGDFLYFRLRCHHRVRRNIQQLAASGNSMYPKEKLYQIYGNQRADLERAGPKNFARAGLVKLCIRLWKFLKNATHCEWQFDAPGYRNHLLRPVHFVAIIRPIGVENSRKRCVAQQLTMC